jgi:hypothetical protein
VHNVVYVVTAHDSVVAFDADGVNAAALWQRSFLGAGITPVPAADTGACCALAGEIGITGTPVIDPSTGTLYVVARTREVSGRTTTYAQRLHALDITTGAERFGGPVLIKASVTGTGEGSIGGFVAFDPLHEQQRAALLLSNGVVYMAFGSDGDSQPHHGWVLGYNAATLKQSMAVNVSPNAGGRGIWQTNAGLAADASGNIYVVTGDGQFDTRSQNRTNYGNSFLRITPSGTIADFFTPHDQATISANNLTFGGSGPLMIPDQPGQARHLIVGSGRDNTLYVVDRDNMGGFKAADDGQIVQSLVNVFPNATQAPGSRNVPVYFDGTMYVGPGLDNVQGFKLTSGLLATPAAGRSLDLLGPSGADLAISATGAANGILWAIQRKGDCAAPLNCDPGEGVLQAYDPSNLSVPLYSSDQAGTRDVFDSLITTSVPLVANGKVFVTSVGRLMIFGLLP